MAFSPMNILGIRKQFLFLVLEQLIAEVFLNPKNLHTGTQKVLTTVQFITESQFS